MNKASLNRIKSTIFFFSFLICFCIFFNSCKKNTVPNEILMPELIDQAMKAAEVQSLLLAGTMEQIPDSLPRTLNKEGQLVTSPSRWWCSGFFPGVLWQLYEYSGNEKLKNYAWLFTNRINKEQFNTGTHDLGFMLYCSYGNALRLTQVDSCKNVLINGSKSLSSRYNPIVGCIQSWNKRDNWNFPVIIDNMMNLEMLMWAFKETQDTTFRNIAMTHANTTIRNHFRPDYSSYHVVSYNPETGEVEVKATHQGYNDESSWSRGQAWGLYGYEMMYRETGEKAYLDQAVHIADFILNHPRLPEDKIPYWDFDAPKIPDELRDASAAAVIASALIELSQYVDEPKKSEYIAVAEKQIRTLASPEYTAAPGTNGNFILKHGVGFLLSDSEVDVPLTYSDYYYIEALHRYKKYILK